MSGRRRSEQRGPSADDDTLTVRLVEVVDHAIAGKRGCLSSERPSCCGVCPAVTLRAVESGEFERVGSNAARKTDVRLIAATNGKIDDGVPAGRFRQDLLYRLNVFPITVPPLRQRPDGIPLLVDHFVQKQCRTLGVPALKVQRATMKGLQARGWPGNIRGLENVVERALIATRGTRFRPRRRDQPRRGRGCPAGRAWRHAHA